MRLIVNVKQVIGGIIFVGGLGLLYLAHYINVQVEQATWRSSAPSRKSTQPTVFST